MIDREEPSNDRKQERREMRNRLRFNPYRMYLIINVSIYYDATGGNEIHDYYEMHFTEDTACRILVAHFV